MGRRGIAVAVLPELRFDFFHFVSKVFVNAQAAAHLVTSIEHGAVVAFAKYSSQLAVRNVGVFVTKKHSHLAGLYKKLFAAF